MALSRLKDASLQWHILHLWSAMQTLSMRSWHLWIKWTFPSQTWPKNLSLRMSFYRICIRMTAQASGSSQYPPDNLLSIFVTLQLKLQVLWNLLLYGSWLIRSKVWLLKLPWVFHLVVAKQPLNTITACYYKTLRVWIWRKLIILVIFWYVWS